MGRPTVAQWCPKTLQLCELLGEIEVLVVLRVFRRGFQEKRQQEEKEQAEREEKAHKQPSGAWGSLALEHYFHVCQGPGPCSEGVTEIKVMLNNELTVGSANLYRRSGWREKLESSPSRPVLVRWLRWPVAHRGSSLVETCRVLLRAHC